MYEIHIGQMNRPRNFSDNCCTYYIHSDGSYSHTFPADSTYNYHGMKKMARESA